MIGRLQSSALMRRDRRDGTFAAYKPRPEIVLQGDRHKCVFDKVGVGRELGALLGSLDQASRHTTAYAGVLPTTDQTLCLRLIENVRTTRSICLCEVDAPRSDFAGFSPGT